MNLIEAWKKSDASGQIMRSTGKPPFIFRKTNTTLNNMLKQWYFSDEDLLANDWVVVNPMTIEEKYKTLIYCIKKWEIVRRVGVNNKWYSIHGADQTLPKEIWDDIEKY